MKKPLKRSLTSVVAKPLARAATPAATQSKPVLSTTAQAALRSIATTLRARARSTKDARVPASSVSILFTGANPAGRQFAAETLAKAAGLELARIDLGSVVSKYIGETEKNLARIFATAKRKPVVLFFDEADALFGKRSEVKDSHDRYANQEVSYLLERIEALGGVAILATNRKTNIDPAFLRRLRYVVAIPRA